MEFSAINSSHLNSLASTENSRRCGLSELTYIESRAKQKV